MFIGKSDATTRRTFLGALAAACASPALLAGPGSRMGIASTSFAAERSRDTLEFLEYCHNLGAAGIQCNLSSLEPDSLNKLRARAQAAGMYLEVIAELPKMGDASQFERVVRAAKDAGARCVRVACLSGRRYESFRSLADWEAFGADSYARIRLALPVAEKHRVPMAIENHKDWTLDDLVALLKQHSSEYLGVCLDTGNNVALLDDPNAVVEALAPYAVATHFKDVAVEPYADGFLLSEVPLGEGMLDLPRFAAALAKARPAARLTLEMITRSPLAVPCLTDAYWASFPNRGGLYLARTLALVHNVAARLEPLPRVNGLSASALRRLGEENVKQSLNYARRQLGL